MGDRSSVAEKVRKLMRLSKGAGTEAEAQAAAEQATRIITKHGLSWTEVQDDEDPEEPIDVGTPTEIFVRKGQRASLASWESTLGHGLGQLCGCFVFVRHVRYRSATLQAVGRVRDLQILSVLYPALRSTIAKLIRQETKSHRQRRRVFSPVSYGSGLVWGIMGRMRDEQNAVLDEIRRGAQGALVPVDTPGERARRAEEEFVKGNDLGDPRGRMPDFRSAARGLLDAKDLALPGQHVALTGQLALPEGEGDA